MRKNCFFLLVSLISSFFIIHAQVDTLEYLDEHYLHQWRDDSAAVCTHNGIMCTRTEQKLYDDDNATEYHRIPQELLEDYNYGKEFAAGFTIDSTVKVIGFAVVTDTLPRRDFFVYYGTHASVVDTSAERWSEHLRLYSSSLHGLVLLKDTTVYHSAPFTRIKKHGYFSNDWDGHVSTGVSERYCNMYKYFFDTEITLRDSFYISFTRYTSVINPYAPQDTIGNLMYALFEMELHYVETDEYRYPFNRFMFRSDTTGQWRHIELPTVMNVFAILELPGDSCPAVSGLHITGAYGSLVMAEWDTSANNSQWEVSYGPVGTEPDNGTIITCMEPVAKILNLNVDSQYVVYVRPVCRFGIDKRGEWSEGVVFNPLSGEVGIEHVADTEPLTLYPNPASGTVRIGLPEGLQGVDVRLYDMAGREVMRSTSTTLDVSHLPQGTYTVRAATATGTRTGRLVVAE